MTKNKVFLLTIVTIATLFSVSCASQFALGEAQESLRRGDKVGAVLKASEAIKYDGKNSQAVDLLISTFPDAVNEQKEIAERAQKNTAKYHFETVVLAYSNIHAMNDAIRALPGVYKKDTKTSYTFEYEYFNAELSEAKEAAAEVRYEEACNLANEGKRLKYREAFYSFEKTLSYVPEYKDAKARMEEAKKLGSDRIVVAPFQIKARDYMSNDFATILYDDFIAKLINARSTKLFLQVIERTQLDAIMKEQEISLSSIVDERTSPEALKVLGANIMVFGQLNDLTPVYPQVTSQSMQYETVIEVPIPNAVKGSDGKIPTMKQTVYAVLTTFYRFSSLSATISYRAVNLETSEIIDAKSVNKDIQDNHEWAVYSGDKRAIPSKYLHLLDKKDESVRTPQAMMAELADDINSQVSRGILSGF